jgi:hypothetical protein
MKTVFQTAGWDPQTFDQQDDTSTRGAYLYQILQQSNNCTTQTNSDQRLLQQASRTEK